jgi:hypothetical protein
MRPEPGQVLHFSEDPSIARFEPHVAPTSTVRDPLVWAVDAARAPGYWFPRACPRAMAWARPGTTAADRAVILGPGGGERVHAIVPLHAHRRAGAARPGLRGAGRAARAARASRQPGVLS